MTPRPMLGAARALEDLPATWRAKAEELERYASPAAVGFRECAAQLEAAQLAAASVSLTLAEAALESGMHTDHIRHLISSGKIPNAGRKGAPRVKRADLPRKPGRDCGSSSYDPDADALQLHRSAGSR